MTALFWHRRDLRINDNKGLFEALKQNEIVHPIFIFDKSILDKLPNNDQRILFIYQEIESLKKSYQNIGSDLWVYYGEPSEIIPKIAQELNCSSVYFNNDYEPYALQRDQEIQVSLNNIKIEFIGNKDHVIFEKNEVLKDDEKPYTIFTPYSRKWKANLKEEDLREYSIEKHTGNLVQKQQEEALITLEEMGFESKVLHDFPDRIAKNEILNNYHLSRNFPAVKGTSKLSLHLRFGTISIRKLALIAREQNETYLNELIWRDFYQMIIFHFPKSAENSFKAQYDKIIWEKNEAHFDSWCTGKTGYPIVDAGMRELNATGFMHNRVRMVVASFLTKHLLLDWRLGAAYFAEKLLDFELASNTGGWQWAAGCGCDAAPYFRVFNPQAQQEKFDKSFEYIKKWVPEYGTSSYPKPIIEHKFARERILQRFKTALNETNA
ncbi:MAG: deoxyribodipyrimidine photo-lyase [Flavobacteriia bacterium]|nr:deoxyribodipyrimidine photo-lyase [Flavobacteriia bacterium]